MQQPPPAYIERHALTPAPPKAPPSPLAAPPLSLAWPTSAPPPALTAQKNELEIIRSTDKAEMTHVSSSDGQDSFEEEDQERRTSDPYDRKRLRPTAPSTSSSHRDPHKLDLKFPSGWTPADDVILVKLVETSHKNVTEALSYLDDDAVSPDSSDSLDNSFSPTSVAPWTVDEDARLVAAIKYHSPWSSTQPMTAILASLAASSASSRSAWPAIKTRFDSLAADAEPERDRTAVDLAERWRHLQYSTGTSRTRRAAAESAVALERAEWTRDELERLVDVVVGLGGRVERNAAGWDGGVEATSRWIQVLHGLGKSTSLIDVCLAWCEGKDGPPASPAAAVDSPTSRSPSPIAAAESFARGLPPLPSSSSTLPPAPLRISGPSLPPSTLPSTSRTPRVARSGFGTPYTAEEDAVIIADCHAGVAQRFTAKRLRRPLSGIRGRVKALRMKGVIPGRRAAQED
ncbi:hypothetical protein JCM9279_004033 [Rhodotorula babjevae]